MNLRMPPQTASPPTRTSRLPARDAEAPRPLRERGAPRLMAITAFCVLYAAMDRVYMQPYLESFGLHGAVRQAASMILLGPALLVVLVVATSTYTTDWSLARLARPKLCATLCAATAGWLLVQVLGSGQRIVVVETPLGFVATLMIVWFAAHRYARHTHSVHRRRLLRLENIPDADTMIGLCEQDLANAPLTADERATVELNLAGALVTLSRRGDHVDRLPEAYQILSRVAARRRPVWTFAATERLVEAMAVKAERSGEHDGCEAALDLLVRAADDTADILPHAPSRAHALRAERLVALGEHAASEGDPLRQAELCARADADHQRAMDLAPGRRLERAQRTIAHASGAGANPLQADLDVSIVRCRHALATLALSSWNLQARGMLALADLLTLRALLEEHGPRDRSCASRGPATRFVAAALPSRITRDRVCALVLCLLLIFMFHLRPEARSRVPELLRALRVERLPFLRRWGTRRIDRMYRDVYSEQTDASPMKAVSVAARWANWTGERADAAADLAIPEASKAAAVARAAEAHACWIRAVVADTRRRTLLEHKQGRLSRIDGQAARACAWLVRAGRPHEAALVLELGRAVLLTERMSRERPGIEERLRAAGLHDLCVEWRAVRDRIERADRVPFADDAPPPSPERHDSDLPFASAGYLALADHERLVRRIGRMPGFEDVDAPLEFADIQVAAREGPIVYLSLTDRGGLAIVVTSDPDPAVVELQGLTPAALREQAPLLLDPGLGEWAPRRMRELSEELGPLLQWLWHELMEPVARRIEPGALVTLIAGGELGQLPLTAACATPDASGVWRDRTDGLVFRYVPNARVLMRSQAVACMTLGSQPGVVSVAVPESSATPLRWALTESLGVCDRLREGRRVEAPFPAGVDAVLPALERCAIWHFACHGHHVAADPLESRLLLADGAITLRRIFSGRPVARRLAVLSACQTAAADSARLDEVVSFPSALLQAGVAGVVCAHALIFDDEAAMLLVLGFFDRLVAGMSPPRALADARDWLRSATSAEIQRAFPSAYAPSRRGSPDDRPFGLPDAWATLAYFGA